jgi:hypothetical protein
MVLEVWFCSVHYDEGGLNIVDKLEDLDTGSPVKAERKADLAIPAVQREGGPVRALAKSPTYVLTNTSTGTFGGCFHWRGS